MDLQNLPDCVGRAAVVCRDCSCVVERHYCMPFDSKCNSVCSYQELIECDACKQRKLDARMTLELAKLDVERVNEQRIAKLKR